MTQPVNPLEALQGTGRVVAAMAVRSRRNWRGTLIVGVAVPLFFLLSLGFGLGTYVGTSVFAAGVTYGEYIAPAMLAAAALQYGISEGAEPVMAGFKWQRTYEAATATPISTTQLFFGHLCWISVRVTVITVLFFGVMAALGLVVSPLALLTVPTAVVGALASAAPVMAFAATVRDGSAFVLLSQFVVLPMSLLSGTFFPVDQLPAWTQALAWALPLSHSVALNRSLALGDPQPAGAGHLIVLLGWLAVGVLLAVRRFRVRLTA